MTKILPWSPSGLDQFVNCPAQFHGVRVLKKFPQTETEQQRWGNYVHKAFEVCQAGVAVMGSPTYGPLPDDLVKHEPFMRKLWEKPGQHFVEFKGGFNKSAKPCGFSDNDVWCRLVIDYLKVEESIGRGLIVDYKTGKPHSKFEQLYLYCIYVFEMFPFVDLINAQFYWTTTQEVTKKVIGRNEIPELWAKFIPNLRQYVEAFKTDTWQKRPSGLCHGYCPDTGCEHWREKRR